MAETTIRVGAPLVTLINVFTVNPKDQERLVDCGKKAPMR